MGHSRAAKTSLALSCPKLISDLSGLLRQECPRQIIAEAHGNHDHEPEEARNDGNSRQLPAVKHMHKEEYDQYGFDHRNGESHHGVPYPQVYEGNPPSQASAHHKREENHQIESGSWMRM
jgi:hypothetical protein